LYLWKNSKSIVKKRTHKLDFTPDYDFLLFGLVSDEPDYRLAWLINRTMEWDMKRTENLKIEHPGESLTQEFAHYTFVDEKTHITYRLIGNRGENGTLLEELKNIDFFLSIHSDDKNMPSAGILSAIKSMPAVRAFIPVDPGGLRSKNKLLF